MKYLFYFMFLIVGVAGLELIYLGITGFHVKSAVNATAILLGALIFYIAVGLNKRFGEIN